jgi:hypothetical protein
MQEEILGQLTWTRLGNCISDTRKIDPQKTRPWRLLKEAYERSAKDVAKPYAGDTTCLQQDQHWGSAIVSYTGRRCNLTTTRHSACK